MRYLVGTLTLTLTRITLLATLVSLASVGCKKEKTEVVLEAPVASFDQAPAIPSTMPTVNAPVQSVPVGNGTFDKAQEAAAEGRTADVRRLLEAKVRSGHASPEEVRLVREACKSPFDKACLDDLRSKYP